MNTYSLIVSHYDDAMDTFLYDQYLQLIKKHAIPKRFLEIGAGTAKISLALHDFFQHIDAFDVNKAMVKNASKNNPYKHVNIFTHDMRQPLLQTYDCIAAPIDVFNHLSDFTVFKTTLSMWLDHLNPNGIFLFDVLKCDYLTSLEGYQETLPTIDHQTFQWRVEKTDTPCQVQYVLEQDSIIAKHYERSYPIEDIEDCLSAYRMIERIELEERIIYMIKK